VAGILASGIGRKKWGTLKAEGNAMTF